MSILTPQRPAQPPAARADASASPGSATAKPGSPANRPLLKSSQPTGWLGISNRGWLMAAILTALFVATYWTSLIRLWRKTNPFTGTEEWAHAIFIPIVGLYYLFLNLDELLKAPVKPLLAGNFNRNRFLSSGLAIALGATLWKVLPHLPGPFASYTAEIDALGVGVMLLGIFAAVLDWGLGTLIAGLLTYAYGVYPGANDFVKDVGMVMSVFGMVLTCCGWRVMRIAWFPCVFLFFALPWPGLFYSKVAGPMQQLAAHVAMGVMSLCGVDVENAGVKIIIHKPGMAIPRVLNVAEACAGIKSLMTFVSLGAAIGFLSDRALWQKLLIAASAVPIAIGCNVMRVTGQGLLDYYVDESWSSGFAHQFAGIVLLLPGFLILLLVVWTLDKLFIEEDETLANKPIPATGVTSTGGGAA